MEFVYRNLADLSVIIIIEAHIGDSFDIAEGSSVYCKFSSLESYVDLLSDLPSLQS